MINKPLAIFSITKNIENIIIKNNINKPIFENVSHYWFNKTTKIYSDFSKKIYNDIENNYYNHKELALCLCYEYIFNKKINLFSINHKKVKEVKKIFSQERLDLDKKTLIDINKSIKLKSINDFFKINEDGMSIIYHLIKDKTISPIFYLYFMNKNLTIIKENIIIDEYKRFELIMSIVDKILFKNHKEVLDGKA